MPELPEVEVVRRSLEPGVMGRRIDRVEASGLSLRSPVVVADWQQHLLGRSVERLERRGKYLLVHAGAGVAVLHLGMSGRLALAPSSFPRAVHTHLVVALDSGNEIRLVDPRRFGIAVALASDELDSFGPLRDLGPDPLAEDVLPALLAARSSRAPIRNLLLDQRRIAGLGNIYATEALFRAGIHPASAMRRIGRPRLTRLATAIREVLEDALRAGGTTLMDRGFADALGEAGSFVVELAVYGRSGEACPRCCGTVRRRSLAGRSVFFCPVCQRR